MNDERPPCQRLRSNGLLGNLAVSSQRPDAGALAEIGLTFLSGSQRVPTLEKNERSVFEYTYPYEFLSIAAIKARVS